MQTNIKRGGIGYIYVIVSVAFLLAGCVKSTVPYTPPVDMNFTWETTQKVSISVPASIINTSGTFQTTAVKGGNYATTVQIYSSPLFTESSLLASGAARAGNPFETFVDLPTGTDEIYVKSITPQGLVSLASYTVTGLKAVLKSTPGTKGTKASGTVPVIPQPAFPPSYDVTIASSNDLPAVFTGNKTYYIPAGKTLNTNNNTIFSNQEQNGKPVVYVAGSLIFNNANDIDLSNCTMVVLRGGMINLKGVVNVKNTTADLLMYVQKGGEIWMEGLEMSVRGASWVNEGSVFMAGECVLQGGALLYNTGYLLLRGDDLELEGASVCYNTGIISADNVQLKGNAMLFNYDVARITCSDFDMEDGDTYVYQHGFVEVKDEMEVKGKLENYGSVSASQLSGESSQWYNYSGSLMKTKTLSKSSNFRIYMESGSILYIYEYTNKGGNKQNTGVQFINENKNPLSDFALVLWGISDNKNKDVNIQSKGEVSFDGNIENYCPKKNESQCKKYTGDFCTNNAFWANEREYYIPESPYNEGLGKDGNEAIIDADGDGVPKGEDIDDNDPDVAYVSYFPSKEVWGTYFFEDLYPWTGDYDMNDMVLGFRIAYYTDAAGRVTFLDYSWQLNAVGSTMGIACGVQLDDIAASAVQSIRNTNTKLTALPIGGGADELEKGQSKAVFALFNTPGELYDVKTSINVFHDAKAYSGVPHAQNVRIKFNSKQEKASLSIDRINTFIVVGELDAVKRDKEVHLSTFGKTDLGGTSYYAMGYVSPQNPYKATNGMVWGYMVPVPFRYPVEMCEITFAYPRFKEWYLSGGNNYQKWYDLTNPENNIKTEYLY